jgi:hypothetical protein
MAMKASDENKRLARIRAAEFPLTAALVKLAGATRGFHRRLDLGRARAFADPIDLAPLQSVSGLAGSGGLCRLVWHVACECKVVGGGGGRVVGEGVCG